MIIQTEKGEKIQTNETPHWNDFYKCFYVAGFRFIKSKQQFSGSCILHNFKEFTILE